MRILVTFAVDAEFAPWRKLRHFERAGVDHTRAYSTAMNDAEITVLFTGVGGKKAWVEATKVLWDADVDICISSGLAGALKAEHGLGDVLVAESVFNAERDKTVTSDTELVAAAVLSGAKRVRSFFSSGKVVIRASEKQELGRAADAVEMESGEILAEAQAFGARSVAVRGISDAVDEDLPLDFNQATTRTGDVSMAKLVGQVMQHPGSVPSLMRFGRRSRSAAEKLASFLDAYVSALTAIKPAKSITGEAKSA